MGHMGHMRRMGHETTKGTARSGVGWVYVCDVPYRVEGIQRFSRETNHPPFPLQELHLQVFVTTLSRKVSHKTIKVYLSGLQYFSIRKGYKERIALMRDLNYLIRGVRRKLGGGNRKKGTLFS